MRELCKGEKVQGYKDRRTDRLGRSIRRLLDGRQRESVNLARRTDRLLRAAGPWLMYRWWEGMFNSKKVKGYKAARILACTFALFYFFTFAPAVRAQDTIVTGTITDPSGIPYANATVSATLAFAGTPAPQTCNGQTFQIPKIAQTDANGTFLIPLCPNASILPAATQWSFTVSITPGVLPPLGTGAQSFTVIITIAGATQSVTAQLTAAAPALTTIAIGSGGGSQHQVNAVNVTANNPINIINGTNTTVTNPAAGNIRIDTAGSGISGSGANTQVTFWTGALAISGDAGLTYDSVGNILTVGTAYRVGDTIITNSSIGSATAATFTLQDTGAGRWQLSSGNFLPTINDTFDIGESVTPLLPRNITASQNITAGVALFQGANRAVDQGGAPLTPGAIPVASGTQSITDGPCSVAAGNVTCTGDVEAATLSTTASADGGVLFPNNTTQTVSGATQGRIIYDNATLSFKASVNGGAYANIGALPGGSGTELQFRSSATAFGGAAGTTWDNTNRDLTWAQGTLTTSNPFIAHSATWNGAGVVFVGGTSDITDTASADLSVLQEWRVGGVKRFAYEKNPEAGTGYQWVSRPASGTAKMMIGEWNALGFTMKFTGANDGTVENLVIQSDAGATVPVDTQSMRLGIFRDTYGTLGGANTSNSFSWHNRATENEPFGCWGGTGTDCAATTNASHVIRNADAAQSTRVQIRAGATQGTNPLLEVMDNANTVRLASISAVGRFHAGGNAVVAGDLALSAGWGTTATDAVTLATSRDQALVYTITSGGTGQAVNATITWTFGDGTWTSVPVCMIEQSGGTGLALGQPTRSSSSATAYVWIVPGLPVAGSTYEYTMLCVGT